MDVKFKLETVRPQSTCTGLLCCSAAGEYLNHARRSIMLLSFHIINARAALRASQLHNSRGAIRIGLYEWHTWGSCAVHSQYFYTQWSLGTIFMGLYNLDKGDENRLKKGFDLSWAHDILALPAPFEQLSHV